MIKLIKILLERLHKCRKMLKNGEEIRWVDHIDDETVAWPNSGAMYANMHGFDAGPGVTYWIGFDIRTLFIRTADYVIKFKNKATYDKYLNIARGGGSDLLKAVERDSNLTMRRGGDVETKFTFKWADSEKSFNVRFSGDFFAEEK